MGLMKEAHIQIRNDHMEIKALYDAFEKMYPGMFTFEEYLEAIIHEN